MNQSHRAFFITSSAHLVRNVKMEVMFGIYPEGEATPDLRIAEMAFRWYDLENSTARLEVFDESWAALAEMPDVVAWIGTLSVNKTDQNGRPLRGPVTLREIVQGLERLGFENRTDTLKA